MERPPVSPALQAQMGPPGGSGFGEGVKDAQAGADKSPVEIAVATVEKMLMGVQSDTFKPYAMKAIATLKVGAAMDAQKQPKSPGMGAPPQPGGDGGAPKTSGPPIPGQMPG